MGEAARYWEGPYWGGGGGATTVQPLGFSQHSALIVGLIAEQIF